VLKFFLGTKICHFFFVRSKNKIRYIYRKKNLFYPIKNHQYSYITKLTFPKKNKLTLEVYSKLKKKINIRG